MQRKQTHKPKPNGLNQGFTIIELLIVIVIIAILVAIVTVSYNGITRQAKIASLKSDLKNASTQIELTNAKSGSYPTSEAAIDGGLKASPNNTLSYAGSESAFCVTATNSQANLTFSITQDGTISEGACPLQFFTSASCPSERTLAVDARDNRTYWIQKLADGNCWMLTNLAYGSGGNNIYGDTKEISNGTADTVGTNIEAKYYVHPNANFTAYPKPPSVAMDGGMSTSTRQYGYLYNWCAAMGNQQGTSACTSSTTPAANTAISICPAGWRLPTGQGGSPVNEFKALNDAVNGGLTSTDAGLRGIWLGQYSGSWYGGSFSNSDLGYYWTSRKVAGSTAYSLSFRSTGIIGLGSNNSSSEGGLAVRCVSNQ